ncbi:hypothetical protein GA0061099_1004101 [Bradyrhizobium yuanmingense]|uniref:Uncharacterized protein n=1 Tax=Bradyrhizobium yuanmingense TaxID=108015 RepID=A0A1C3VJT2_9BRAD|nr:hypothetical protein [Bradyrhizobium yuanmingense]TWI28515.1 hypothetical protein IQ15_01860 [Bradyrhizobium yuanmingense]SCB28001.1 hypothetical protein GA0061099_1004101 [Bradyrhizobium yuanmingense]
MTERREICDLTGDKLKRARSQLLIEIRALDAAIVEAWDARDLISIVEGKRAILEVVDQAIGQTGAFEPIDC